MPPKPHVKIVCACQNGAPIGRSHGAIEHIVDRYFPSDVGVSSLGSTDHTFNHPSGKVLKILRRGINPEFNGPAMQYTKRLEPKDINNAHVVVTDYSTPELLRTYRRGDLVPAMERAGKEGRVHSMDSKESLHRKMAELLK